MIRKEDLQRDDAIDWHSFVPQLDDLERIEYRNNDPELLSAVYFLFNESELIYVGQTNNLNERLYLRRCAWLRRESPAFTHYAFIECPAWMRLSLESLYIQNLNPRDNWQQGRVSIPELQGFLCC